MILKISVIRRSSDDDMLMAASFTVNGGGRPKAGRSYWYRTEHSPARVDRYFVLMEQIPTFVSVHLVRHGKFAEHFVTSNRDDRGGAGNTEVNRNTPVRHLVETNAQELVNISKERLCFNASSKTVAVWSRVRKAVGVVNPELKKFMVPKCVYRGGLCPEYPRMCKPGLDAVLDAYSYYPEMFPKRGSREHKS